MRHRNGLVRSVGEPNRRARGVAGLLFGALVILLVVGLEAWIGHTQLDERLVRRA